MAPDVFLRFRPSVIALGHPSAYLSILVRQQNSRILREKRGMGEPASLRTLDTIARPAQTKLKARLLSSQAARKPASGFPYLVFLTEFGFSAAEPRSTRRKALRLRASHGTTGVLRTPIRMMKCRRDSARTCDAGGEDSQHHFARSRVRRS